MRSTPTRLRDEGVACYREFIAGLLDVTDNLVAGRRSCRRPRRVRYDGDDPYLVVAADKGTATFSDIANEIAGELRVLARRRVRVRRAAPGTTTRRWASRPRGAWESVRRHARAHRQGRRSRPADGRRHRRHVRRRVRQRAAALAAPEARRCVRPSPRVPRSRTRIRRSRSPSGSGCSRCRAAAGPTTTRRSSRAGGGVFPRTAKSIDISPRGAAGARRPTASSFTPAELISAILRAPVDVLWNGGIGTYVKASTETHAEVGDRANDALRVNGIELRCKIVAEGGNLGVTQRGRIEYALAGGLIYTDAIDNSAGVDCSDHEVNIKILLRDVMASTGMTLAERDALLASMTDEVGELVLDDNRAQTLALAIARRQALPMVERARPLPARSSRPRAGSTGRSSSCPPTSRSPSARRSGIGLTTPEFAVLLAYTKTTNIGLRRRQHAARRPVPRARSGPLLPDGAARAVRRADRTPPAAPRDHRDAGRQPDGQHVRASRSTTGSPRTPASASSRSRRAWVAARDIFDVIDAWERDRGARRRRCKLDIQLELFLELRRMVERSVLVAPAPPPPADRHRAPSSTSSVRAMRALVARHRRRQLTRPDARHRCSLVEASRLGVRRAGGARPERCDVAAAAHVAST